MSEIPNISEEYNYFEKLFDNAEKEQIGDLYKKELYIMKEDLDSNKYKTTLKLMHDTLLQKFMCEEYTEFIPKNEVAQLIYPPEKKESNNNNKTTQKEDAADKELLEEYEYLKELYRLNYLTFSPFALEYFEKINDPKPPNNKNNDKNEKDLNNNSININNDKNDKNNSGNGSVYNMNNNKKEEISEEQNEKDNKLLKLLNFDYNSFELNNDLLFNISQGFIDISKLKESNLKYSDKNNQNKDNSDSYDSSKNDEFDVYEYDEELNQELIDKVMKFVKLFDNNLLLKRAIVRFKDELSRLPPKCKNKIKNEFYKYWDAEFTKLEKDNERLIKRREEEERKQQLLKQKMYLDRLIREKQNEEEKKIDKENEFINQLRKLQNDAKIKSGVKEKKPKEREKIKRKKRKNVSASPVKKELIRSNKKYYCSGFNMYKEILSNKQRNASSKK